MKQLLVAFERVSRQASTRKANGRKVNISTATYVDLASLTQYACNCRPFDANRRTARRGLARENLFPPQPIQIVIGKAHNVGGDDANTGISNFF